MEEGVEDTEMNITGLPVEVLSIILQQCSCRDVLSFSSTCKGFREVVLRNQLLWKNKLKPRVPHYKFLSLENTKNVNWLTEIKGFCLIKKRVYNELMKMSPQCYWLHNDISLEHMRGFFVIALSSNENYYYVIFILQDLIKKTYLYTDNNHTRKPFTMTEMFYAKVALRHLVHTFQSVKWVQYHMKKILTPDIVVNFFLQWSDCFNWYPDGYVTWRIHELAKMVKVVLDEQQPHRASLSIAERIASKDLNEKQVLAAIAQVIFNHEYSTVTTSSSLYTLDLTKVLQSRCAAAISIAAIFHAVASLCSVSLELVSFPNHLFLEWRDLSDKDKPVVYSIDFNTGQLKPKRKCPFSKTDHSNSYKYCPDSFLQYIFSAFRLSMGAIKNWSTQNASHLLDFLGTNYSPQNPYRNFLSYLFDHDHISALDIPLRITDLHDDHILLIRILAFMNPNQKAARKELVVKRRESQVKFAVGLVCFHRKLQYVGVVRAWDPTCDMKLAARLEMELDLEFGVEQPFYHLVAADKSNRYVAQENLDVLSRPYRLYNLEETIAREFTHFDGFAYVPCDEKRAEYPEDGLIVTVHRKRNRMRN